MYIPVCTCVCVLKWLFYMQVPLNEYEFSPKKLCNIQAQVCGDRYLLANLHKPNSGTLCIALVYAFLLKNYFNRQLIMMILVYKICFFAPYHMYIDIFELFHAISKWVLNLCVSFCNFAEFQLCTSIVKQNLIFIYPEGNRSYVLPMQLIVIS